MRLGYRLSFLCRGLLDAATDAGHTKLLWLTRCSLWDTRFHLLQLRSFRRCLDRCFLGGFLYWAFGPLHVYRTLDRLHLVGGGFGALPSEPLFSKRGFICVADLVVVTAWVLLDDVLQDRRAVTRGRLHTLCFLLPCDGL